MAGLAPPSTQLFGLTECCWQLHLSIGHLAGCLQAPALSVLSPRHDQQQRMLGGAGEAAVEEPAPPLAHDETAPSWPQRHAAVSMPAQAGGLRCLALGSGCSVRVTSMAVCYWV